MLSIKRAFKIVGTGTSFPANKITSEMLEKKYGIPEGWSLKNSGVAERYHATYETVAQLGAEALNEAMANAGIELGQIGMLISGSATYDHPLPNQSSLIKGELKDGNIVNIPCVDINTTCLGFVTALDYASRMLDNFRLKYIAIVCSEIASKGLDASNWETLSLFGDGAAAVIIKYDETNESGAIHYDMQTYSEGVEYTIIKGGGNKYFFKDNPYSPQLHSFTMEGIKLLKLAKNKIPEFMNLFFKDLPIDISGVDYVFPHQASKMGLKLFNSIYNIDETKQISNLGENGNCISASIPLMLCDSIKNGKLESGDTLFLTGTSAGFAIGGLLIRY